MSYTDYREYRRSLVKAGIQHYSSGSSHWRDVQEAVTMPQSTVLFTDRRLSGSIIRKDLRWLLTHDPEVVGMSFLSGSDRFIENIKFARSG